MNKWIVALLVLIVAMGCNKGGSNFDWSTQPHQNIVPPPIARWDTTIPTVYIDYSQVHGYPGDPAPTWIAPLLASYITPRTEALRAYSAERDHNFTQVTSIDKANVVIRFYCGKYVSTKGVSSVDDWLAQVLGHQVPVVVIDESDKAVSAAMIPPRRENNWNGVVYMRAGNRTISSADCWLNVYAYEWAVELAKSRPDLNLKPDAMFASYMEQIFWHEGAHWAWGLADDVDGCLGPDGKQRNGLMNYKGQANRPNEYEDAVIRWLY